jgi:hypothetical protein
MGDHQEDELLDYEEEEAEHEQAGNGAEAAGDKKAVKGSYVSIHSSGFRDFLLKPELLRAIVDCGFEHPSEGELGSYKKYKVFARLLDFVIDKYSNACLASP